jgi:CheY-like chemotaxis protein
LQNRRTHGRQWRKILVIDDDEQQREIATSMLLRLGMSLKQEPAEKKLFQQSENRALPCCSST